jgi:hypothetical protein
MASIELFGTIGRVATGIGVVVGALGVAGALVWGLSNLWRWWRSQRKSRSHRVAAHPNRQRIFRLYRRAQRRLGSRRSPTETVQEHAAAHPEMVDLAAAVDVAAYRPEPPDDGLVMAVQEWLRGMGRQST